MGAPKKLDKAIYITTVLEEYQHEALKKLAYKKRVPMAELIRIAITKLINEELIDEEPKTAMNH